jgi:hypothetical protein
MLIILFNHHKFLNNNNINVVIIKYLSRRKFNLQVIILVNIKETIHKSILIILEMKNFNIKIIMVIIMLKRSILNRIKIIIKLYNNFNPNKFQIFIIEKIFNNKNIIFIHYCIGSAIFI